MAYDEDFRRRAIKYYDAGNTAKETAKRFKIALSTLYIWKAQLDETNAFAVRKPKLDPQTLLEYIKNHPDAYQKEIAVELNVSTDTVAMTMRQLQIKPRKRRWLKIDPNKLRKYIEDNPNALIREIAAEMGVHTHAIDNALKRLGIKRKNQW